MQLFCSRDPAGGTWILCPQALGGQVQLYLPRWKMSWTIVPGECQNSAPRDPDFVFYCGLDVTGVDRWVHSSWNTVLPLPHPNLLPSLC